MKKTVYQIEKAPAGSDGWEQIKPIVEDRGEAVILLQAHRIEARCSKERVQFRIRQTTHEFLTEPKS